MIIIVRLISWEVVANWIRFFQQQMNGKKLASLYSNLIGTKFDPKTMYVRSTDVSRTFASIESLLLALFPTVCIFHSFPRIIYIYINIGLVSWNYYLFLNLINLIILVKF
jgi:hypothetical protein